MREWPESFLTPETLATGRLANVRAVAARGASGAIGLSVAYVTFENLRIAVRARDPGLLRRLGLTVARQDEQADNVIGDIEIAAAEGRYAVVQDGRNAGDARNERRLLELVTRVLVNRLTHARPWHCWLHGAAFTRTDWTLVVAGDLGDSNDSLSASLPQAGWDLLGKGAIAIRANDLAVLPLGCPTWPLGAKDETRRVPTRLTHLVVAERRVHTPDAIAPLGPAAAVTALMRASLDFQVDRDRAVERLCRLVEHQPVAHLSFSRAEQAARLFSRVKNQ